MIFNKLYEAKNFVRDYKPISFEKDKFPNHLENDPILKFGQYILFQHVKIENKQPLISKPILGLFVGYSIWDMAAVINIVELPRAYIYSEKIQVVTNPKLNISLPIFELDPQVENFVLWHDDIIILGIYNNKPNWKNLRIDYKKRLYGKI